MSEHSDAMEIKINRKKTKILVVTKKDRSPIIHLRIDSDGIEQVDDFVYLGGLINWDGRQEKEMRRTTISGGSRPELTVLEHWSDFQS